jgi:peroxiredoxin
MFRSIPLVASVVAFASLAAVPALAVPHAGDSAPAFTLPKASGGTLSSAQLRGKPAYLNFFASWCAPCNAEAASVGDFYKKFHKRGLSVIGVNEQEDKSKALGFAAKYHWPFPVVLDDGNMGKDYGAIALPVHIFIDKRGKVSTYRLGEMAPNEIEEAIAKIL